MLRPPRLMPYYHGKTKAPPWQISTRWFRSILLSMQRQSGIFEVRGDAVFGEWSLQPSEFGRDMLKLAPVISQARVIHEFFEGSMSEWFEHYLMGRVTLSAYRDQETP